MTDIGLFEAIHTARSLRRYHDTPVPDALITQVLDAAIRAPSGGNSQHWTFIVVRDPAARQRLGAIYRKAAEEVSAIYAARPRPAHLTEAQYKSLPRLQRLSLGTHGRRAVHPGALPETPRHAPA